jgi:hypothetical protein
MDWREHLPSVIKGKTFQLKFEPSTSDPSTERVISAGIPSNLEVMIYARTFQQALAANQLIEAADCLVNGVANSDDINNLIVYAVENEGENQRIADYFGLITPGYNSVIFQQKPDTFLTCKITARASFRRKFIIALHKYFISCNLHCNHGIDLDPTHAPYHIPLPVLTSDHLRYAYAIMISYSIIEELQLEVRASSNKPTYLPNGDWNPKVRTDLEARLTNAGIDISETVLWNVRGGVTTLEKRRRPKAVCKAEWAYGDVRDCEVNIIDAISDLSWMRSKITAHKVDADIKKLSVYDVNNAQHLARRLILESLEFWRALHEE